MVYELLVANQAVGADLSRTTADLSALRAWFGIRTILLQVIIGPPSVRTPPTFSYARRMSPRTYAFRDKINNKEEDI